MSIDVCAFFLLRMVRILNKRERKRKEKREKKRKEKKREKNEKRNGIYISSDYVSLLIKNQEIKELNIIYKYKIIIFFIQKEEGKQKIKERKEEDLREEGKRQIFEL